MRGVRGTGLSDLARNRRQAEATYRRRTDRKRPPERWNDEACAAWRAAHQRAGVLGAWTYTPVVSAAALLVALDRLGACNGAALAREAGVPQGHATSVTLPRFDRLGLVDRIDGDDVEGAAGRTGRPICWHITAAGRELARALRDGEIR